MRTADCTKSAASKRRSSRCLSRKTAFCYRVYFPAVRSQAKHRQAFFDQINNGITAAMLRKCKAIPTRNLLVYGIPKEGAARHQIPFCDRCVPARYKIQTSDMSIDTPSGVSSPIHTSVPRLSA